MLNFQDDVVVESKLLRDVVNLYTNTSIDPCVRDSATHEFFKRISNQKYVLHEYYDIS